jgi:hypothetical protein
MKRVYIIGFRGVGFHEEMFTSEPALIHVGHVGIAFEGDTANIYGFHPTEEAVEKAGGETRLLERLKEGEGFEGCLQADWQIFARAAALAQQGRVHKSGK